MEDATEFFSLFLSLWRHTTVNWIEETHKEIKTYQKGTNCFVFFKDKAVNQGQEV